MDRARAKIGAATQVEAARNDPTELNRLAARLIRADKRPEARLALARVLELDPDCRLDRADDAAMMLSELDEGAGDVKGALAVLEKVSGTCTRASAGTEVWNRMAALATRADPAVEERVLRARAGALPDDAAAQSGLAAFLARTGKDLGVAERAARHAVERAPDDPSMLGTLAEVLLAEGRTAEARSTVEKAIAMDPHDTALRELRLKITLRH